MTIKSTRVAESAKVLQRQWTYVTKKPAFSVASQLDLNEVNTVTVGPNFPQWRARMRAKNSCTTSLLGLTHDMHASNDGELAVTRNAVVSGKIQWVRTEMQGSFGFVNLPVADPNLQSAIASVDNAVIQQAIKQIIAAETTYRSGQDLGEMRETLRMIKSRSSNLYSSAWSYLDVLALRGRRLRRIGEMVAMIGNTWLEFAFGWKPLISSIYDGANALAHIITYRVPTKRFYSEASGIVTLSTSEGTRVFGPLQAHWKAVSKFSYGVKIYGAVKCVPPGGIGVIPTEFGLALDELVPTLWELIPYSFLVDYFTNVGGIVDAWSVNKASVAWINRGEERINELVGTPSVSIQDPPAGQFDTDVRLHAGSDYKRSFRRISRDSYDLGHLVPSLEFKHPGLSMKWLNIAALGAQSKRTSQFLNSRLSRA